MEKVKQVLPHVPVLLGLQPGDHGFEVTHIVDDEWVQGGGILALKAAFRFSFQIYFLVPFFLLSERSFLSKKSVHRAT